MNWENLLNKRIYEYELSEELEVGEKYTINTFTSKNAVIKINDKKILNSHDNGKATFIADEELLRVQKIKLLIENLPEDKPMKIKLNKGGATGSWNSSPKDIDRELKKLGFEVIQQAGLIEQKVSATDYNGEIIASKITQTPEAIDAIAKNINLTGKVNFNSFNSEVQSIIESKSTKTEAKSYASNAEGNAKIHADEQAGTAEANAKSHAEEKASSAESNAKSYADNKIKTVNNKLINWEAPDNTLIDGNKIYTGSILADSLAANSIIANKIAAGAITTEKMNVGSIQGDRIKADTLNANRIIANSITASKIASGAIIADKIHANAVTADKIASRAITADKIEAGAITIGGLDKTFKDNLDAKSTKTEAKKYAGDAELNAKSHANTKASTAEGNAKKYADDQDKVIDAKINNAVTRIDGTGVTVKDGSFFLEDETADTKYSIVSGTNLINDHSFELHEFDEVNNSLVFGDHGTVKAKRNIDPILKWETIGEPYFFTGRNSNLQAAPPMFGLTAAYVNNNNYFRQSIPINDRNQHITISSYFRRYINDSAPTPVIEIRGRVLSGESGGHQEWTSSPITKTFPTITNSDANVRHSVSVDLRNIFTESDISSKMTYLYVTVKASNSRKIMVDGVQVVEGKFPVHYDPEDSLFKFMGGVTGAKAGHVIAKTGTFDNLAITNNLDLFKGLPTLKIPSGGNLDNYKEVGFYHNPSNAEAKTIWNMPEEIAFSLLVEKHAGVKQTFSSYETSEVRTYVRNFYNNTWSHWQSSSSYINYTQYGTYIKHADGRLEQFGSWTATGTPLPYGNIFYVNVRDLYFPISFSGNPDYIQTSVRHNFATSATPYELSPDRIRRVIVYTGTSSELRNVALDFYSVGRWK